MKDKSRKLTAKQERFVQEYMIDLNGAKAAERAGYSKKTARSIANENLTKPDIQRRIVELQLKARELTEITKKEIIQILTNIIRNDTTEFFDGKKLKPFDQLSPNQRVAIDSIKITKAGTEIKPSNRIQAIQTLSRMVGWDSPLGLNIKLENLDDSDLNLLIEKLLEKH